MSPCEIEATFWPASAAASEPPVDELLAPISRLLHNSFLFSQSPPVIQVLMWPTLHFFVLRADVVMTFPSKNDPRSKSAVVPRLRLPDLLIWAFSKSWGCVPKRNPVLVASLDLMPEAPVLPTEWCAHLQI